MRPRSLWRETDVLLRLIGSALWPDLPIKACLHRWNHFQGDLAERRCDRVPRVNRLLS